MMEETQDLRVRLGKPEVDKLKALGDGLQVGVVFGNRILCRTIEAYTDMDRVEKEGVLVLPPSAKEANTPLPSTAYIVKVGTGVSEEDRKDGIEEGVAIMFSKYAGTDFVIDGVKGFRMLDVREIMCTLLDTKSAVIPIKEAV